MRIKWLNHPTEPTKNGTLEHVSREFAVVACGYKQAEVAPYKNYVERLNEESKLRTGPSEGDVVVSFVHPPRWELGFVPVTKKAALYYLAGTEKTCFRALVWYDDNGKEHPIPALADCPKELRERFKNALATEGLAASGALQSDRAEQQARQDYDNKHGVTRFFNRLGIDISGS